MAVSNKGQSVNSILLKLLNRYTTEVQCLDYIQCILHLDD